MNKPYTMKKYWPRRVREFWDIYESLLKREVVGSCETLLDVGCGSDSPVKSFSGNLKYSVGVDLYQPSLERSKAQGIHHHYEHLDVLKIGEKFDAKSFDCVVALDLIEHLGKEEGARLIQQMEHIARKKVIIFTPNGLVPQSAVDKNNLQEHLSGWTPAEMRQKGFRVYGVNGWKFLRGDRATIKFWPKWFWVIVSKASQLVIQNRPDYAFQLLCIRDVS